jgi:hypothetical protein
MIYTYSEVSYQLILDFGLLLETFCDGIEGQNEAVEFAIRSNASNNGRWIPLRLSFPADSDTTGIEPLRGFSVPLFGYRAATVNETVAICGGLLETNEVQFRWMESAASSVLFRSDLWALSSVMATLVRENETMILLQDTFGGNMLE